MSSSTNPPLPTESPPSQDGSVPQLQLPSAQSQQQQPAEIDDSLEARAAQLKFDPRTNLEFIDVPEEYAADFEEVNGSLMHYFAKILVVSLRSKTGKERTNERFMLITDCCVYLLETGGIVTRCHHIKTLRELLTSRDNDLGLRFPDGPDRYDLMIIFNTSTERDRVIVVLKKIFQFFTDRPLPYKNVDVMRDHVQLRKPDGWLLKIEPLIPKKLFLQEMDAQKEGYSADQNEITEEFERVKANLEQDFERQIQRRNEEFAQFKREYQSLQDAHNNLVLQYDSMAQDVETYVRMLDEKDTEIQRYRSGDHPVLVHMEHEVEKLRLRQELDDQRTRGDNSKAMGERDQEIQHLKETLRYREEELERAQMDVKRREEELSAADAAVSERDRILVAKERECSEKDAKLQDKEQELRYTKSLMKETFKRQVEEIDTIKSQFQSYDTQMIAFIGRLHGPGAAGPPPEFSELRSRSPNGRSSPLAPKPMTMMTSIQSTNPYGSGIFQ